MNSSKTAVVLSQIVEKIQLIIGIGLLFLFGICTVMALVDKELASDGFLPVCLVLDVIGIVCILFSRKRHKLVADFKKYVTVLSNDPTGIIDNMAAALNTSSDVVKKNIEQMIKRKYFANAYIDAAQNRLVLNRNQNIIPGAAPVMNAQQAANQPKMEYITVSCKGCGGINKVAKGMVAECEYCGSSIKGE